MTYRVIIHNEALEHIERNAAWWAANRSRDEAVRWYAAAFAAIYALAESPESHGLAFENDDFPYEIRDRLFGLGSRPTHRAVFAIEGQTVHVFTVRSASQAPLRPDDVDYAPGS